MVATLMTARHFSDTMDHTTVMRRFFKVKILSSLRINHALITGYCHALKNLNQSNATFLLKILLELFKAKLYSPRYA
jgi:hypothetical protein